MIRKVKGKMYLIVGLGNPGKKYEFTRHNTGFLFLDFLAASYNIKINKIKFKGVFGEGKIENEKVILLKPSTFMNLSGESVREAMDFYKLTTDDIIIVYDDISLPLGKLRIREKGSAGGHNGIKNIILHTKSESFKRIRVGIDDINKKETDPADFVLKSFSKEDLKSLGKSVDDGVEALKLIIKGDILKAMNLYN